MAFTVGEKVLVFHLGNLYDAKILKVENERYFIHYQGWKDRWDEWVDDRRISKLTDEGRRRQDQLQQSAKQNTMSKYSAQPYDVKQAKKHAKQEKQREDYFRKYPHVVISTELKRRVSTDWSLIVGQDMVAVLPRTPNVKMILDAYVNHLSGLIPKSEKPISETSTTTTTSTNNTNNTNEDSNNNTNNSDTKPMDLDQPTTNNNSTSTTTTTTTTTATTTSANTRNKEKQEKEKEKQEKEKEKEKEIIEQKQKIAQEYVDSVRLLMDDFCLFFDECLGTLLLVRAERPQYAAITKMRGTRRLSEIYGFEHLLRMLVMFPVLIQETSLGNANSDFVGIALADLLDYFNVNIEKFPLPTYEKIRT